MNKHTGTHSLCTYTRCHSPPAVALACRTATLTALAALIGSHFQETSCNCHQDTCQNTSALNLMTGLKETQHFIYRNCAHQVFVLRTNRNPRRVPGVLEQLEGPSGRKTPHLWSGLQPRYNNGNQLTAVSVEDVGMGLVDTQRS